MEHPVRDHETEGWGKGLRLRFCTLLFRNSVQLASDLVDRHNRGDLFQAHNGLFVIDREAEFRVGFIHSYFEVNIICINLCLVVPVIVEI